jgi:hypothetical protein
MCMRKYRPGGSDGAPHLRRIVRLAGRLRESVEASVDQHPLKPIVEDMARRARHRLPRRQVALPPADPAPFGQSPQIPDQPTVPFTALSFYLDSVHDKDRGQLAEMVLEGLKGWPQQKRTGPRALQLAIVMG